MKLQMNPCLHIKVHVKVQKMLQVGVDEGWTPTSHGDDEYVEPLHQLHAVQARLQPAPMEAVSDS